MDAAERDRNDKHFNNRMIRKPELLAPAGGKASLTAAVSSGADAVYMGGRSFNARIYADNFRDDELSEAIEYAHIRGVKIYITLNTLLKDSELAGAFEYAATLYEAGADALIVQDMGLARLLRKYLPDFPMHLSTQGTLYNREAVSAAKNMGFSRVVPARELSLGEIREISEGCAEYSMDTEIFVHGALCMCYSGQCQMSRILGGRSGGGSRSGNRGTCAQPCRQLYSGGDGREYYALSPKDLCLIEYIPELIAAGAASFKIEGRMKSPEYVAVVTRIYRKYIDLYAELVRVHGPEEADRMYKVDASDMMMLKQIFNRGNFTSGYLRGDPGRGLLSGHSPKNQGIRIGRVAAVIDSESKASGMEERRAVRGALKRGKVLVCIETGGGRAQEIGSGDGLEFRSPDGPDREAGGGVTTFIRNIGQGLIIAGDYDRGVETGDIVYKVTDRRLIDEALAYPEKKLPATMLFTAREGQYPVLCMTDVRSGYTAEITADHIVERARRVPTDRERIADNLSRLGDTPYRAAPSGIDVQIDEDIMMPLSVVNRMRREAYDELTAVRRNSPLSGRRRLSRGELDVIESGEMLGAACLDIEGCSERLERQERKPVPLEEFMRMADSGSIEAADNILPYILNVSRGRLDAFIREDFDRIADACRDTGILIGNPGWIERFCSAGVKVYGDYGLNIFNEQARLAYEEEGVEMYMPSHETGLHDRRGIPAMITEHHVEEDVLTDRYGVRHRVQTAHSGDKTLIF